MTTRSRATLDLGDDGRQRGNDELEVLVALCCRGLEQQGTDLAQVRRRRGACITAVPDQPGDVLERPAQRRLRRRPLEKPGRELVEIGEQQVRRGAHRLDVAGAPRGGLELGDRLLQAGPQLVAVDRKSSIALWPRPVPSGRCPTPQSSGHQPPSRMRSSTGPATVEPATNTVAERMAANAAQESR